MPVPAAQLAAADVVPALVAALAALAERMDALERAYPRRVSRPVTQSALRIGDFVEQELVPGVAVLAADVHRAYAVWAMEQGISPADSPGVTRRSFYAALDEMGLERVRRYGGQVFLGVALRTGAGSVAQVPVDIADLF